MGQTAEELRAQQLRADIAQNRTELSDTLDAIGDRVSPRRIAERRKNRVIVFVTSIRERVMGTAQSAADTAGSMVESAEGAAQSASTTVQSQVQGSPLVAGAAAAAVGFIAAAAIPPSAREKQLAQPLVEKAQPLVEEAKETAQEVVQDLKQPVQEAAQELKGTTQEAAKTVADTARDSARQEADEARTAVQNVKDGPSGPASAP